MLRRLLVTAARWPKTLHHACLSATLPTLDALPLGSFQEILKIRFSFRSLTLLEARSAAPQASSPGRSQGAGAEWIKSAVTIPLTQPVLTWIRSLMHWDSLPFRYFMNPVTSSLGEEGTGSGAREDNGDDNKELHDRNVFKCHHESASFCKGICMN